MTEKKSETSKSFIHQIIDEDNKSGKFGGRVHTRFPPEPNGFLHIGHAKSICLNYGISEEYGGKFNLRFDDTNPTKEETEYVESIIEDVRWLGADWEGSELYASDYFDQLVSPGHDSLRLLSLLASYSPSRDSAPSWSACARPSATNSS